MKLYNNRQKSTVRERLMLDKEDWKVREMFDLAKCAVVITIMAGCILNDINWISGRS